MNDVAHTMLGAALVAVGILVAALADRVRALRVTRERSKTAEPVRAVADVVEPRPVVTSKADRSWARRAESKLQTPADEVIGALVAAGYKRQVATEAVRACTLAERATIEDFTSAALRRCARGGMS
jgi:hypothetical protein